MTIWIDSSLVHLCSCNFALKEENTFLIISSACWVMKKTWRWLMLHISLPLKLNSLLLCGRAFHWEGFLEPGQILSQSPAHSASSEVLPGGDNAQKNKNPHIFQKLKGRFVCVDSPLRHSPGPETNSLLFQRTWSRERASACAAGGGPWMYKGGCRVESNMAQQAQKRQVKMNDCGLLCVSLTVPCSELMFVNPVANDTGHLHDVGEVM